MSNIQFSYFTVDHIIVYIFLIAMLLAGLFVGCKIKDIKEYSIASKNYGTTVLLLTLFGYFFRRSK